MENTDKPLRTVEATTREIRNVEWKFDGTVVMITGAARGQGRSHALAFARAGADLALCDIDQSYDDIYPMSSASDLEQTVADCEALGAKVHSAICDVRDAAAVERFVTGSVDALGQLDVVIANAGISRIQPITQMREKDWDTVVDVNLKGVYMVFAEVARYLEKTARPASLIATGSVHSFTGTIDSANYVTSKHGVAGLCKALAVELAPKGIRVNYVCPAAVNTRMIEAVDQPDVPADWGVTTVANTGSWNLLEEGAPPLQPQEVTEAMLWLASDSSAYVTGSAIVVDAGFIAK